MIRTGKIVSLQDIALEAGVHKATVHRALRGDRRVEAGTAERIRAIATRLGYDANANQDARVLSLRKSGHAVSSRLLALILPVVAARGPYFHRPFVAFMAAAQDAGYDVLLRILDGRGDDDLPAPVMRGEVDAIVALAQTGWLRTQQQAIDALAPSARRPIIGLINGLPGGWLAGADFHQGGRLAMGHLLDLGHRRIIGISGLSYGSAERSAGYVAEARARGLDPAGCLLLDDGEVAAATLRQRLEAILDRLLARMPEATALLAPNDEVALLLCALLAERGRPVPERMSLIGFDDTHELPGPDGRNRLSTIALPLEQIGRAAAGMAMAMPPGEPSPPPQTVLLPAGLRVRGTARAIA